MICIKNALDQFNEAGFHLGGLSIKCASMYDNQITDNQALGIYTPENKTIFLDQTLIGMRLQKTLRSLTLFGQPTHGEEMQLILFFMN